MSRKANKELVDPWLYKGEPVIEIPEGAYGFIYCITEKDTGKIYIGQKAFHSYHKKVSYVRNERTGRMNKVKDVEVSESNWKDYFGSNVLLKQTIKSKGKSNYSREILRFVRTKKELTYFEAKEQFSRGVLEPEAVDSYNDNILGKFYRSDFINK